MLYKHNTSGEIFWVEERADGTLYGTPALCTEDAIYIARQGWAECDYRYFDEDMEELVPLSQKAIEDLHTR